MQGTLSSAEMDALLTSEVFGHLGCIDAGRPYVVPMAYVYHDNVIYGQTTEGRKIAIVRQNPTVCFQVEHKKEREWRSVICWGTFQELDFTELTQPDAIKVAELLTKRIGAIQEDVGISVPFTFSGTPAPLSVNDKTSTLFRIVLSEKTGRWYRTDTK